jgi:hypothetical protein
MKSISVVAVLIVLGSAFWQGCSEKKAEKLTGLSLQKGKIDFNYHVKPILSDKCFACHGPDVKKRQAEFRLDTEEGAFKALKSNPESFRYCKG